MISTLTYRALPLLLCLTLADGAWSRQRKLAPCAKALTAEYNNCIGAWTDGKGYKYLGEWQNGKANGHGAESFANGDQYFGEYRDNKHNGQGTLKFGDGQWKGDQYVGDFKDGHLNGEGTYNYADGNVYIGQFRDNMENGHGTTTFANGDKYVGDFKDGHPNGQGTYTFANGNKYAGEYRDSGPYGSGVYYGANGAIIQQGIFENGILKSAKPVMAQASGNNHRVQMVKDGGTYAVPVLINNVLTLHFIVDSGATDVMIPGDVALTLIRTGTIGQSDFIGSQKYQLADGSVINSPQFIVRTLKVGGQTVENVRVSIGDLKGSLLLGQSFLEKFKSWSMDNVSHELVLQ